MIIDVFVNVFDEGEYNKICHDIYALGVLKSFFNNQ